MWPTTPLMDARAQAEQLCKRRVRQPSLLCKLLWAERGCCHDGGVTPRVVGDHPLAQGVGHVGGQLAHGDHVLLRACGLLLLVQQRQGLCNIHVDEEEEGICIICMWLFTLHGVGALVDRACDLALVHNITAEPYPLPRTPSQLAPSSLNTRVCMVPTSGATELAKQPCAMQLIWHSNAMQLAWQSSATQQAWQPSAMWHAWHSRAMQLTCQSVAQGRCMTHAWQSSAMELDTPTLVCTMFQGWCQHQDMVWANSETGCNWIWHHD